jgi:DNA-binding LacI/PurR family transcriptional regulator
MGINHMPVVRVWARAGVKPRRMKRYMTSDDPELETKAADAIALYLNPPQHAAIFCVDEKTAVQAIDRLDPVLPLSPGRIGRHGFEYYRHGTLSLYAALNTKRERFREKRPSGAQPSSSSRFSRKWSPARPTAATFT